MRAMSHEGLLYCLLHADSKDVGLSRHIRDKAGFVVTGLVIIADARLLPENKLFITNSTMCKHTLQLREKCSWFVRACAVLQ